MPLQKHFILPWSSISIINKVRKRLTGGVFAIGTLVCGNEHLGALQQEVFSRTVEKPYHRIGRDFDNARQCIHSCYNKAENRLRITMPHADRHWSLLPS